MDAGRLLDDRRRSPRIATAGEHRIARARVRPGHEASVLNASTHGALIETACRLLPGRTLELQLERSGQRSTVRGRVLRSKVVRVLPSSLVYQGAIGFEKPLAWPNADEDPARINS